MAKEIRIKPDSKESTAVVAVIKSSYPDTRIANTRKTNFDASLCPKSDSILQASKTASLAVKFDIGREIAPREIYSMGTTFENYDFLKPFPLAMVRFRVGKIGKTAKADIININLQAGKYSWTDGLLVRLANEIGNYISKEVSAVGSFAALESNIRGSLYPAPQQRLLSIIKGEFQKILPISDESFFERADPGK